MAVAKDIPQIAYVPLLRVATVVVLGVAAFALLPHRYGTTVRALWGWDLGVFTLIAWIMGMMAVSTHDHMKARSAKQDPGRFVILTAIVLGALISVLALAFIQKAMKASQGGEPTLDLVTIVGTIFLSWFLVHTVFTLHYAHGYYGPSPDEDDKDGLIGGLNFPDENQPDYWDFMYFSFVVGMTCQVSDVEISGRLLRRLALFHGIVSFFFNTIILALTINILASAL